MLERQNVLLAMNAVSFAQYFNRFKATPNKRMQADFGKLALASAADAGRYA
jgi:hypothetical protein